MDYKCLTNKCLSLVPVLLYSRYYYVIIVIVTATAIIIIIIEIKKIIDKENISPLCRMCGKWDETIAHIVAECLKFAQKQHKSRKQNKVAIIIYWMLCKKTGCERAEKWYDNKPEGVMWTEKYKLIKTDQTCYWWIK